MGGWRGGEGNPSSDGWQDQTWDGGGWQGTPGGQNPQGQTPQGQNQAWGDTTAAGAAGWQGAPGGQGYGGQGYGGQQPGDWDDWDDAGATPPNGNGNGGPPKWLLITLIGVLAGALIALLAFVVLDRDSGDASDPAGVTTAAPSEEGSGGAGGDGPGDDDNAAPTPTNAPDQSTDPGSDQEDGNAAAEPSDPASSEPATTGQDAPDGENSNEVAPAAGTYSGTLVQRGTRQSDRDYEVQMTFSSTGSTVSYPELGCRGTLTPTGNQNGARVYREHITSGGCDSPGTWLVTRGSDTSVAAEYRPAGDDYVVAGQLTR